MATILYERRKPRGVGLEVDARFKLLDGNMPVNEFGDLTQSLHLFFREREDELMNFGLDPDTIILKIKTL